MASEPPGKRRPETVPLIETGAAPSYACPRRAAMAEPLSDRAREVLHAIIREYISTGDPVGSQQLARTSGFEVSSATLRNVMADLEELGYLEKPHTSAGRLPTDRAYRFYVDTLIRLRDPNPRDRDPVSYTHL